jgi:T5SS/PEP-CTERM-associated repeat protein
LLGGSNNNVVVTGLGSVLSVSNEMTVGQSGGSSNTMVISDGGQVFNLLSHLGDFGGGSNVVLVTGSGSVWSISDHLWIPSSGGMGNSLMVKNGGTVITSNIVVQADNSITLNDGNLTLMKFLTISSNAVVSGCGTINGSVVVDPGGTLLADYSGNLILKSNITNNGTMRAINGGTLEFYGTVVNNGVIDIINGSTNFHGAFINNGVVLDSNTVHISSVTLSDPDAVVQIPSLTGHSYQLQVTPSLSPANWTNAYPAQAGNDGMLIFTDPGGATNDPTRFYRINVTAP